LEVIKNWVEVESETLCPNAYPDVVAAVLDCNASTALLTLNKILVSFQRTRSRSGGPGMDKFTNPSSHGNRAAPWKEDSGSVEYWKERAIGAFEHVRRESMIASKVLDFGVEQLYMIVNASEENGMMGSIVDMWK
jgi:hypothetical protein